MNELCGATRIDHNFHIKMGDATIRYHEDVLALAQVALLKGDIGSAINLAEESIEAGKSTPE